MKQSRINWVDTLKFLGIFAIYLGHYGEVAKKAYPFVFEYHVPLFFFISGFFFKYNSNESIIQCIKNKFKHLMIPYFTFSLIYLLFLLITKNIFINDVPSKLLEILTGIRNYSFIGPLWFINCLFVMQILNKVLSKIYKDKKYYYILTGFVFLIVTTCIFPMLKINIPCFFWNIDSALYYYFYFTLGMILYPKLNKIKLNKNKPFRIIILVLIFIFLTIFTYYVYKKGSIYLYQKLNINNDFFYIFYYHIKTMILIIYNVIIAQILSPVKPFQLIGRNTLYLCCIELMWKSISWKIFTIMGIYFNVNMLHTLSLYIIIILYLASKCIIIFKKMVKKLKKYFKITTHYDIL